MPRITMRSTGQRRCRAASCELGRWASHALLTNQYLGVNCDQKNR